MSLMNGRTRDERREKRSSIGTLRENTVGLKARKRYNSALSAFYAFCQSRKVRIPDKGDVLDEVFSDYIEFLWECGDSLSRVTCDGRTVWTARFAPAPARPPQPFLEARENLATVGNSSQGAAPSGGPSSCHVWVFS